MTGETVELHHRIEGPEDAPVLVPANSLGTTLSMWDAQVPALRERFRLVRHDHRGHGGSPVPPGRYEIEDLGRNVLVMLDRLEVERWFTPAFRSDHRDNVEWAASMLRETPAEGYAGCCEAIRDADSTGRLASIRTPTLVIAGTDDPAGPPEQSVLIRDSIPDARLEVVPKAAHLANIEQPRATTGAVLDHLDPVAEKRRDR